MEKKSTWLTYSDKERKKVFKYADSYMDFLNNGKTERECVDYIINDIEKNGYVEFSALLKKKKNLSAGDKVYFCNMNKDIVRG